MSISQVQAALAAYPGIRIAYVFGSVATGRARLDSDVDVAVLMEHPLDTTHRMQLIETLGRPVDLIDLHTVGEPLLGQILKHGQRIIGDNSVHAEMLIRHVYAMEDFMPYVNRMLEERWNTRMH